MQKIHMIGNAHIDPVWLWQWQEGFAEIKATFQSALDRLEEYDGLVFTCAGACYYQWVEENAPEIPENPEADSENPMDGAETEAEFRTAEPADLLVYGSWGRRLVNNSFLLHGYYNYGHLLFGMEDGMEFLGVPGEFCLQEKMMAALFGFPEFRTIDTFERETGNTGYWLRRLDYGSAGKIHESGDRAGQKGI